MGKFKVMIRISTGRLEGVMINEVREVREALIKIIGTRRLVMLMLMSSPLGGGE